MSHRARKRKGFPWRPKYRVPEGVAAPFGSGLALVRVQIEALEGAQQEIVGWRLRALQVGG